jgi:oligoribonuclease
MAAPGLGLMVPADRLVWIDCEMTGLDLQRDALVEVAVVITDGELATVASGMDLVMSAPEAALSAMEPVVRDMHVASGLLLAIRAARLSVGEAERQLLEYVRRYVPEPNRAPLCGNTIATDRAFLARDMPELERWMHYRMIDVSSIKELCRRWYPRVYYNAPEKRRGHRALTDIHESIDELRYYRSTIFVPQPGPDSASAKGAAAAVTSARPEPDDGRSEP